MYINWKKHITVACLLNWYPVEVLVDYLHSLRAFIIEYSLCSENAQKSRLPQFPLFGRLPASEHIRFPNDQYFVYEGTGTWQECLDCILLSAGKIAQGNHENMIGSAEIFTLHMINQLIQSLEYNRNADILISRHVFEKRYRLVWIEKKKNTFKSSVYMSAFHDWVLDKASAMLSAYLNKVD